MNELAPVDAFDFSKLKLGDVIEMPAHPAEKAHAAVRAFQAAAGRCGLDWRIDWCDHGDVVRMSFHAEQRGFTVDKLLHAQRYMIDLCG